MKKSKNHCNSNKQNGGQKHLDIAFTISMAMLPLSANSALPLAISLFFTKEKETYTSV